MKLVRALLAGVVLMVAGCSSGPTATEWAAQACAVIVPWRDSVSALTTQVQAAMRAVDDPDEAKSNLVRFLGEASTVSDNARRAMAAVAAPDVTAGAEVAAKFVVAIEAARDVYGRARDELTALSTQDADTFYDGVAEVLKRLFDDYAAAVAYFDTVESVELSQALDSLEQCQ